MAGLVCFMVAIMRVSSFCAHGEILFWNINETTPKTRQMIPNGIMMRRSGMPADFMAVSSNCSPMLPNTMSEVSRILSGSDMGTSVILAYPKKRASTSTDSPLPTKSSTKRHRNCMINTNKHTKNAPAKSVINFFRT